MLKCYIKPPPIKLYLFTMAVAGEYLIGSTMVPLRYSFYFWTSLVDTKQTNDTVSCWINSLAVLK